MEEEEERGEDPTTLQMERGLLKLNNFKPWTFLYIVQGCPSLIYGLAHLRVGKTEVFGVEYKVKHYFQDCKVDWLDKIFLETSLARAHMILVQGSVDFAKGWQNQLPVDKSCFVIPSGRKTRQMSRIGNILDQVKHSNIGGVSQ